MRIAPWVLSSGFALLAAGIVSSGSDAWKQDAGVRVETFDMTGVDAVEIGDSRVDELILANQDASVLRYTPMQVDASAAPAKPVASTRRGQELELHTDLPFGEAREISLRVPARVTRLSGHRLSVRAEARVPSLRLTSSQATWQGDAGMLDVRMRTGLLPECTDGREKRSSSFGFVGGAVPSLRIRVEQGVVRLGDLSRVASIELHAGPDVRLDVSRLADLQRIRIVPLETMPATASAAGPTTRIPNNRASYAWDGPCMGGGFD